MMMMMMMIMMMMIMVTNETPPLPAAADWTAVRLKKKCRGIDNEHGVASSNFIELKKKFIFSRFPISNSATQN